MLKTLTLLATAGMLLLAGCTSTPTTVDQGPIRARTFSFMARAAGPFPQYADSRQPIHDLFQDAISRHLTARGLTRTGSGGDITVAYLIIVGDNASTETINEYFGYRDDGSALHDKAHTAYTGRKDPEYFKAGTLVIDLLDPKTSRLLHRGHTSRRLLRDLAPESRATRVQETVDEILREVRIAP